MDPSFYDEFGNYVGPENINQEELEEEGARDGPSRLALNQNHGMDVEEVDHLIVPEPEDQAMELEGTPAEIRMPMEIVLHEEKEYYPSARQVYGDEVETLVQEEDLQPLSIPIIAPIKEKKFQVLEKDFPTTTFTKEYLFSLSQHPEFIRNLAIVGQLHHGKTSLVDMLVEQTHPEIRWDLEKNNRYTDIHLLERDRGISIKSAPISLVMSNLKGKHFCLHLMDTPGHVDFIDEVVCALRLCDGAILVVDAAEGVMANTERILKKIIQQRTPFVLVLNKIDRLIMELKLPPTDAYVKLKHVIEAVNAIVAGLLPPDHVDAFRVSPERNNVCFASTEFGFCFTLKSFAELYADVYDGIHVESFAFRLWGDIYYNEKSNTFHRSSSKGQRSFIHFLLEPLYKLFSITLGESSEHIKQTFLELGVPLKKYELEMDVAPLLRVALSRFFGHAHGFVDMVTTHVPDPQKHAKDWLEHTYTGEMSDPMVQAMVECDASAPLVIHIAKLYPREDASTFDAFGRILSGTVKRSQAVKVLGEGYSKDDEEDSVLAHVKQIAFYQSRYQIPVPEMTCGNLVLLAGISASLVKTGTLVDPSVSMSIFAPLHHVTRSVVKVAIEPVQPSELPKMLEGLRKINKSYPLAITKVEESGEHILLGTGELYMDCLLHDLRRLYTEIEIKVSDPVTKFSETVSETSAFKCFAESPNRKNKLTMIVSPLDKELGLAIECGKLDLKSPSLPTVLEEEFGWDILASRSIWAFGPDERGPNLLLNDTLPGEVDKSLLNAVKESIKQGFQWGTREGPLCDEPIQYCQFKLIDAHLAPEPMYRGGGQLIPTARRLVHSSFLMATPRLMEPVFFAEIQTPAECISAVYSVLTRRRGHVTQEVPKPGTPLYTVKAYLPVIDSFGFETDLRTHTQGQAFSQHMFDHDQMVPGDPVDKTIHLRPLEPAPTSHLARDFMIKTRRRKGLSEDVAVAKYFDEPMLLELAKQEEGSLSRY